MHAEQTLKELNLKFKYRNLKQIKQKKLANKERDNRMDIKVLMQQTATERVSEQTWQWV